ncbi:Presenilin-2 [Phytophthora pseudosyringae]|uniref:Presenilin-2 n=1 Tax=Phytophthora pseudosyringae TaxID=221518 RepID=A0A8T1VR21_9STRA|nr:Presenilin-2 [Phytophthora pseudosyringae]
MARALPAQAWELFLSDLVRLSVGLAVPPKEIHRVRRKYNAFVKGEDMTKDEFYALPAIAVNPLRDQLFKSLELTASQTIAFAEFAKFVQIFSYSSSQDAKLKEAFKIHDFDGDGKISRDDLRAYCALVLPKVSESEGDAAVQAQQEVTASILQAPPGEAVATNENSATNKVTETLIAHVMSEASSLPSRDFLLRSSRRTSRAGSWSRSDDDATLNSPMRRRVAFHHLLHRNGGRSARSETSTNPEVPELQPQHSPCDWAEHGRLPVQYLRLSDAADGSARESSRLLMAKDGEDGPMPMDNTALLAAASYDKLTTPNSGDTPASGRQSAARQEQGEPEAPAPQGDSYDDLMHGINSFWAIVFPVCVTMIVASLVVVNYRSSSIEASMSTYLVYGDSGSTSSSSSSSSTGSGIGESLVNALVIIGAIAVLTFGMALLYKYNCMKFLSGYIMFASTAILSFVGGQLVDEIVNGQFGWAVDWPSFLFVMVNFGFVGVISIFYQKGTPKFVQNGYLVMVSVILAWEFSMWPEWTTITFCVMFACYDLCAVLTPCGPLKYLIGLIQEKQAPLPGLLYEADVRDGVSHDHHRQQQQQQQRREQEQRRPKNTPTDAITASQRQSSSATSHSSSTSNHNSNGTTSVTNSTRPPAPMAAPVPMAQPTTDRTDSSPIPVMSSGRPRNVAESNFTTYECETMEALVSLLTEFYETFSPEDIWKGPQVAEKFFPTQDRLWLLIFHKYYVCSCSMDMPCPVQARRDRRERQREEEDEDDKTIKLGLGDFIFYSVLVGRAAIKDFATFAVTFVCIVMGLGGTLFLLAVLHKALPALPISIFLATIFYFLTEYIFIDFCSFMMTFPAAV